MFRAAVRAGEGHVRSVAICDICECMRVQFTLWSLQGSSTSRVHSCHCWHEHCELDGLLYVAAWLHELTAVHAAYALCGICPIA